MLKNDDGQKPPAKIVSQPVREYRVMATLDCAAVWGGEPCKNNAPYVYAGMSLCADCLAEVQKTVTMDDILFFYMEQHAT